ncbi:MAG TPA: response regulator, partial [candidate division Zixibacteria bacterium]|nr:response regulator [candidate division Zixibacteria bacterium]
AAVGAEAIVMYQRAAAEGNPYRVIILDLTIPGGMGGKETLERLREINPSVKAIVCSGYAVDPVVAEYSEHGFIGCVAKPYRPHEMAEAIQAALNASTSIPADS